MPVSHLRTLGRAELPLPLRTRPLPSREIPARWLGVIHQRKMLGTSSSAHLSGGCSLGGFRNQILENSCDHQHAQHFADTQ